MILWRTVTNGTTHRRQRRRQALLRHGRLLMRSLAQSAPDLPFHLLDFGLDEAQRRFLRERKVLIERPASVPETASHRLQDRHRRVSSRHRMVGGVWLDSDMLVVGPLQDRFDQVLSGMTATQREVAACSVETISRIVRRRLAHGAVCRSFARQPIDLDFLLQQCRRGVRSPDFLAEWWTLAQQTAVHLCIDQNLFTLLALRRDSITP